MSPVRSRRIRYALVCWGFAFLFLSPHRILAQQVESVSVCELKAHPEKFNHQLVEVTGLVSHGFENFTLSDPACSGASDVWLEYGGKVNSGTKYCCGVSTERTRPSELMVEKIPIPLIDDNIFRDFDQMIQRPPDSMVHATIAGVFFSGRIGGDPTKGEVRGYGHMGCCSLLAIEQVVSVDAETRSDLDYRAEADQPSLENKPGCGVRDLFSGEPGKLLEAQRRAESGQPAFAFEDPDRVGAGELAALLKIETGEISHFKRTHESQGRVVYEWNRHGDTPYMYMVVVSKPFWMSFYAKDPKKVAWVMIAAYESSCGMADEKKRKLVPKL
jgi:hypothetical protein